MNKNFTHKSFIYLTRTLPITIVVCFSLLLHPNVANAVSVPIDIQAKTIRCYPNPAISFVNFDIPADYISKSYSLQVYSFTGKKMYEINVNTSKFTLTFTSEFYRGIYVYQLRDKAGKILETGKFQVNK
jgi:hypothetical protein